MSRQSLDGIANVDFFEADPDILPVTEGLTLHLDARQISGLNDGDPVDSWEDESGNEFDATAESGERPTYKTDVLNGEPVVRFGGSETMVTPKLTSEAEDQPNTVFAVWSSTEGSSRQFLMDDITEDNRTILVVNDESNSISIYTGSWLTYERDEGTPFDHLISTATAAAPDTGIYENGQLMGVNDTDTEGIDEFRFGTRGDETGDWYYGDLAEFIFYERALSMDEREEVELYLENRWGIGVDPYNPETPDEIPDLISWFKAEDLDLNDNDDVVTWEDRQELSDLTNTVGNAPTYIEDELNGKPVVRFNGNSGLRTSQWPDIESQPNTIFTVHSMDEGSDRGTVYDGDPANTSGHRHALFINQDGNDIAPWSGEYIHGSKSTPYDHLIANVRYDSSANSSILRVDGEVLATGDTDTNSLDGLVVGERRQDSSDGTGDELDGDVAEILVFNRRLSIGEIEFVEEYLAEEYGIELAS